MKNKKKIRLLTALLAVMLCMTALPFTAYAGGGDYYDELNNEQVPEETAEPQPLTPDGNMSLVDDIEGEASDDKQFITVTSRNGSYFYIIIDRAEEGKNTVHFLNQVDEADLLALIEDRKTSEPAPLICICKDKCKAGEVNTNCPVCKNDMTNCMGKEAVEPKPEPEQKGGMGGMLAVILILALGGGGAFYYFKVLKPKQSVKGGSGLDDFDFEDENDEDEDTELEVFDDEPEREDIE